MKRIFVKREKEKVVFERFRQVCADLPAGAIEHDDEPDFRVREADRCLGVEITEYFHPLLPGVPPLQQQEALEERVIELIRSAAIERGCPPVWVDIDFAREARIKKNDVSKIAVAIVGELMQHVESGRRGVVIHSDTRLPPEINQITIMNYDGLKEPFFGSSPAGWGLDIDVAELQKILDRKEERLRKSYVAVCSENWLVIYICGFRFSSFSAFATALPNLRSSFDRAYLLFDDHAAVPLSIAAA